MSNETIVTPEVTIENVLAVGKVPYDVVVEFWTGRMAQASLAGAYDLRNTVEKLFDAVYNAAFDEAFQTGIDVGSMPTFAARRKTRSMTKRNDRKSGKRTMSRKTKTSRKGRK